MSALFDRQRTTFSARRERRAALRALCAALRVALCAPCVVPDVVLCAPCVVPDAVPYQTSASQWTAWRAWWAACWSGLQHVTPSELQARPQVQPQQRIQKAQERFDDRPASVPNVHPCQAPGFAASCTSHKFQSVGIDLSQPAVGNKSKSRTTIAPLAMPTPQSQRQWRGQRGRGDAVRVLAMVCDPALVRAKVLPIGSYGAGTARPHY